MYIPSPYRDKLYLLNLDLQQEEELEWQTNNSLYNEPSTSTNCQDPLSDVSILSCSSSFFLPLSFLFFQSLSSPATLPPLPQSPLLPSLPISSQVLVQWMRIMAMIPCQSPIWKWWSAHIPV